MSVSILLADDHSIVRKGLCSLLEGEDGWKVTGEASNGLEALVLAERLKPDVVVLDLMMPEMNGLEVTRQLFSRRLNTHVVILSMHAEEAYVLEALKSGALGYVLKDSSTDDLVHAIHQVLEGKRYLSPPLSERAIETYLQKAADSHHDSFEDLTPREREVLQLAAEGFNNVEIGEKLCISPRTVETHRAHLMSKLDLHTQTDLIRYALKRGIIE